MEMEEYRINAILFERDPGEWVAQCLEYDIGAQADTLPNLFYELQRSLVGHVAMCLQHGQKPFESLPSAPPEYWEKWRRETYVPITPPRIPFRLPPSSPRVDTSCLVRAA